MWGFWNSTDKNVKKTKTKNELTIFYSDGGTQSTWVDNFDTRRDIVDPWKDFYKWFFCRKQSDHFMLKARNGETLISRSRILKFEVMLIEHE